MNCLSKQVNIKCRNDDDCSTIGSAHETLDIISKRRKSTIQVAVRPKTKSVTFVEECSVFPTLHVGDYVTEEIDACWLTDIDYSRMKVEVELTCLMQQAGKKLEDGKFTMRGLEGKTEEGSRTRYDEKMLVMDAVLDEQDERRNNNNNAPLASSCGDDDIMNEIAALCVKWSKRSADAAARRGRKDEEEAKAIHFSGG